jgi:hypothetical protein
MRLEDLGMISPQEGFVAVWQGVSSVAGVGNMKILNMKNPSGILFDPEKAPQMCGRCSIG